MKRPPVVIAEPLFVERRKAAGRKALARHAAAILELRQRTARNIIKIGEHLTAARDVCGHGNWQPWLEREFGWTDETARNFMHVFELAKAKRVWNLNLPLRSLYLLARPSTSEAVRQEALDRAESGEPPSYDEIKEAVADEVEEPKKRTPTASVPGPPAPDELDRINALFGQLDQQSQVDCLVGFFRKLDRHRQQNCFLRLRQIASGSA
jgi:hypothetical protein